MPCGEHSEGNFITHKKNFAPARVRTRDLWGVNQLLSPLGLATLGSGMREIGEGSSNNFFIPNIKLLQNLYCLDEGGEPDA